jgi:hypothetical protein
MRNSPRGQCYQKHRNIYHAKPEPGKELVTEVIASFPTCPVPEVARLGRTLKQWKIAILANFDTNGASNGPTHAINGVIENTRRIARGFRISTYRPRCLLAAGGHRRRPARTNQPCLNAKGRISRSDACSPPAASIASRDPTSRAGFRTACRTPKRL